MEHHNYSLEDLNNMMPWEREVYLSLLLDHMRKMEQRSNEGLM